MPGAVTSYYRLGQSYPRERARGTYPVRARRFVPQKAAYTLTADSGSFTLTGTATALTAARKLAAGTGAFTLTGNDADLIYTPIGGPDYTLTADTAALTLTGTATGLVISRAIVAGTGAFVLTGVNVTLTYSGQEYATLITVSSATIATPTATGTIAAPRATATIRTP